MSSPASRPRARIAITLLSALLLFLEMALVRWIGTEIRVFAYLQNGVLVAAFLGLGLGCRNARSAIRLLPATLALLFIAAVIRDPFRWGIAEGVTQGLTVFSDTVIWGQRPLDPFQRTALVSFAIGVTLAVLAAVAWIFLPLGQWLGRWMDDEPRPIAGYTANVLGSLLGIALFNLATVAATRPSSWLAASAAGLVLLAGRTDESRPVQLLAALAAMLAPLLVWKPAAQGEIWSPYQKLVLRPLDAPVPSGAAPRTCGSIVSVNNTSFQILIDLDPEHRARAPEIYPPGEIRTSHYGLPWQLIGKRERVLVVGSGGGNDVAAALFAGAGHVRAVEIDPTIVALGRDFHPNRPYRSARVEVTVDDARAVFHRPDQPYDAVWFGMLDSHTNPSAYTSIRLDHYVYTRESLEDVKRLLRPDGVVVMFFEPRRRFVADRLAGLLHDAFGADPISIMARPSTECLGWGGLLLIGGSPQALAPIRETMAADPALRALAIAEPWAYDTEATTDDWPYLYLEYPMIPTYHVLIAVACLAIGYGLRRRLFRPGEDVSLVFLLLGAGFMMLEVSGVSRAALLFGTTWKVNAYVVGAMLAMVLLANLVASRVRLEPGKWPALGLVLSLVALAFAPMARLAALPLASRVVLGGAFLALPVFFSGLVFVNLWAGARRRDLALGSNMLGALLGGVASLLSMAVGFRALALLTLVVYLAALLLLRRGPAAAAGAAAVSVPASGIA